jgi:hypothetical protein
MWPADVFRLCVKWGIGVFLDFTNVPQMGSNRYEKYVDAVDAGAPVMADYEVCDSSFQQFERVSFGVLLTYRKFHITEIRLQC